MRLVPPTPCGSAGETSHLSSLLHTGTGTLAHHYCSPLKVCLCVPLYLRPSSPALYPYISHSCSVLLSALFAKGMYRVSSRYCSPYRICNVSSFPISVCARLRDCKCSCSSQQYPCPLHLSEINYLTQAFPIVDCHVIAEVGIKDIYY